MSNPAIGYSVGIATSEYADPVHPLLETPEMKEFLDQHLPLSELTLESPDAADGFSEFRYPINYPDIAKKRRLNVISWPLQGAQVWAEYWTLLSRKDFEALRNGANINKGFHQVWVKIKADSSEGGDAKVVFYNLMYIVHQTFFSMSKNHKDNDLVRVCFVDQRWLWQHIPAVLDWGFEKEDIKGKWYDMQQTNAAQRLSTGGDCLTPAAPSGDENNQVKRPFGYPDYYKFRRNSTVPICFAAWMDAVAYGTGGRVLSNYVCDDPKTARPEIVCPFTPEHLGKKAQFHREGEGHRTPLGNFEKIEDYAIYGTVSTEDGFPRPEVYIQSERGDYELTSDGLSLGAFVRDTEVHGGKEFDDAPSRSVVESSIDTFIADRILLSGSANCPDGDPCEGPNTFWSRSNNKCETCNDGEIWNETKGECEEDDTETENDDRGRRVFSPGCNTEDCLDADFETLAKNVAKVYWEQFRYNYDIKYAGIPTWNATWWDWLAEIHVGRLRDNEEYDVGLRIQSAPIGLWPKSLWISTQAWNSTDDDASRGTRETGFSCVKSLPEDISCIPGYAKGSQQVLVKGTDGCLMWVDAEVG
jgi:hypothetical protein